MGQTCQTHQSTPIECSTPRVDSNINCGVCVILMCQCRLDNCNTYSGGRMLIMGEAVHVCGEGIFEKSLYLSLNFAVNLKLP